MYSPMKTGKAQLFAPSGVIVCHVVCGNIYCALLVIIEEITFHVVGSNTYFLQHFIFNNKKTPKYQNLLKPLTAKGACRYGFLSTVVIVPTPRSPCTY